MFLKILYEQQFKNKEKIIVVSSNIVGFWYCITVKNAEVIMHTVTKWHAYRVKPTYTFIL